MPEDGYELFFPHGNATVASIVVQWIWYSGCADRALRRESSRALNRLRLASSSWAAVVDSFATFAAYRQGDRFVSVSGFTLTQDERSCTRSYQDERSCTRSSWVGVVLGDHVVGGESVTEWEVWVSGGPAVVGVAPSSLAQDESATVTAYDVPGAYSHSQNGFKFHTPHSGSFVNTEYGTPWSLNTELESNPSTITVVLDTRNQQRRLSFRCNGKDLGVAFEDLLPAEYRLMVGLHDNNAQASIQDYVRTMDFR